MNDCLNVLLHEQITQQAAEREEDIFYQLDQKNLPLHDALDHFVFSISQVAFALHSKR